MRTPVQTGQGRQRSVLGVILLAVVMAVGVGVLAGVHLLAGSTAAEHTDSKIFTDKVAVIGVPDRLNTHAIDDQVLTEQAAQVGAVVADPGCPAKAWASLSAGRQVSVDCDPAVNETGIVLDWQDRQAEARRSGGELGALAGDGSDCLSSVGTNAALAAVRPDGSTADHQEVDAFIAGDYGTACPVTMIDAGERTDQVITDLAGRDDWTVIVVGMGGDHRAQLIYRLGTTLSGWLTSASADRQGVVRLSDLSRTIGDHISGTPWTVADGDPLQVVENTGVPVHLINNQVRNVDTMISVPWAAIITLLVLVGIGVGVTVLLWRRGNPLAARVPALMLVLLPASLELAGAVGWWRTSAPTFSLVISVVVIWAGLTLLVRALGRRFRVGTVAVVTSFLIFLVDAALVGTLHRSSLLAWRPLERFVGLGGAALGFLLASGVATGVALWRTMDDRTGKRSWWRPEAGTLPYEQLWRPTVTAAVVILLLLGLSWGFTGIGVLGVVAAIVAIGWVVGTLWLLAYYRADGRTRGRRRLGRGQRRRSATVSDSV
ncbi:hypothetical protein ACQCX2_15980 [Propionibacteriaceae bacterium Y1700]|uniref:hypothetical protein n=1 Tax=Microlunatus sp. Y1700 TaxID=3418487 RepID=UPI003DA749DE